MLTLDQFESFVPLWAFDEPKKKKKKVKSGSKKGEKRGEAEGSGDGEGAGAGDAGSSEGKTTGAEVNPSSGGLTQRQGATIEEVEDDEA